MNKRFLLVIVVVVSSLLLLATTPSASNAEEFFKGKTIDIIVGFSPAAAMTWRHARSRATWEITFPVIPTSSLKTGPAREAC